MYPADLAAPRLWNGVAALTVWLTKDTAARCCVAVGAAVQLGVTICIPGSMAPMGNGQVMFPAGDSVARERATPDEPDPPPIPPMPDPPLPPEPPGLPLDPEPLPMGGIPAVDVELPAAIDADPLPDDAEVPMLGIAVGVVPEAPEPDPSILGMPVTEDWFPDIPDASVLPLCMPDIGVVEGDASAFEPFFPMELIDTW
jgi:hypothetical protein